MSRRFAKHSVYIYGLFVVVVVFPVSAGLSQGMWSSKPSLCGFPLTWGILDHPLASLPAVSQDTGVGRLFNIPPLIDPLLNNHKW